MHNTRMVSMFYRLTLVVVLFSFIAAQPAKPIPQNPVLARYYVQPVVEANMQKIASAFEVEHKSGAGFHVLVPINQVDKLFALDPNARLLTSDIRSEYLDTLNSEERAGYHTFETVQSELKSIAFKHPEMAFLEEYGKSMEGRPLLALKLTGTAENQREKPEVMLTSATHGDELITVEVLLGLLNKLVEGYETDVRLTKILNEHIIYFIPVVNPDGYVRQERYSNGVDPNREYPWPDSPNRNPNPCIKNIMNFFHSKKIKASIDFHAYGEMIMYPWAYTYSSIPEGSRFDDMTGTMAKSNDYTYGQISKVIYVAQGSSADYYYWKNKSFSLGIEMAQSKMPSTSQIPNIIKDNTESTWTFLEFVK